MAQQKCISISDFIQIYTTGAFENLRTVYFYNATFNDADWKLLNFRFENIKEVKIKNCIFVGFEQGVFQFNKIDRIQIIDSEFNYCTFRGHHGKLSLGRTRCFSDKQGFDLIDKYRGDITELKHLEEPPDKYGDFKVLSSGVIGNLNQVNQFYLMHTTFRGCLAVYGPTDKIHQFGHADYWIIGEDIWYNKLFKDFSNAGFTATGCKLIKSCDIM